MENTLIYLDTYILQRDMRIRMPKSILENLSVARGETMFSIYLNKKDNTLVLKPEKATSKDNIKVD